MLNIAKHTPLDGAFSPADGIEEGQEDGVSAERPQRHEPAALIVEREALRALLPGLPRRLRRERLHFLLRRRGAAPVVDERSAEPDRNADGGGENDQPVAGNPASTHRAGAGSSRAARAPTAQS